MNVTQNIEFCTKFPSLNNDFSEMKKFQPKPLKRQGNTGLKTPNPGGFWITLKTQQDISVRVRPVRGGVPLTGYVSASTEPFKN